MSHRNSKNRLILGAGFALRLVLTAPAGAGDPGVGVAAGGIGVRVVVATVPDIRDLPEFDEPLRQGKLPKSVLNAYSAAIARFNAPIRERVQPDPRVALLDLHLTIRVADAMGRDATYVGRHRLDRRTPSNAIDHAFLADRRHLGTVAQGRLAQMIVGLLNARFQAGIDPLSDDEIWRYAESIAPPTSIAGLDDPAPLAHP